MLTACLAIILAFLCSGTASTAFKREVDLLDMLRTPLMLSFNRNSAFVPPGEGEKEYMRRFLGMRKGHAAGRPVSD